MHNSQLAQVSVKDIMVALTGLVLWVQCFYSTREVKEQPTSHFRVNCPEVLDVVDQCSSSPVAPCSDFLSIGSFWVWALSQGLPTPQSIHNTKEYKNEMKEKKK